MRFVAALALVAGLTAPAAAQFSVDVTADEMRRINATPAVVDLAVGEVGLVEYPAFCVDGGKLQLYARTALAEDLSEYGVGYRAKRESGGAVALETVIGAKADTTVSSHMRRAFLDPRECSALALNLANDILPVSTIDGQDSLRAIVSN